MSRKIYMKNGDTLVDVTPGDGGESSMAIGCIMLILGVIGVIIGAIMMLIIILRAKM